MENILAKNSVASKAKLEKKQIGQLDNNPVYSIEITNANNLSVRIINFGAIITHLFTPDRNNKLGDIVLGFDSLEDYIKDEFFIGAVVGPYANRIAFGEFSLNDKKYKLDINNEPHTLHSGSRSLHKKVWDIDKFIEEDNKVGVKLTYDRPHMEEGFPGNLNVSVEYFLTNDDELHVVYSAKTDEATVVCMSQHGYYNLSAQDQKVTDHALTLKASKLTVMDETGIPTGEFLDVKNTCYDFLNETVISDKIKETPIGGIDNNYVVDGWDNTLRSVANVYHNESGRNVEFFSNSPGMQVYTSNFLDGLVTGKNNIIHKRHQALCVEPQMFPDSPNKPEFPSVVLEPDNTYHHHIKLKFSVR